MKFKFLILTGFLLVGCSGQHWPTLMSLYHDRQASQLIGKKKNEEAYALYLKNLEDNSTEPSLHSNIGILLDQLQKPDEAVKSLLTAKQLADQQKNPAMQFATRFNLGTHYGEKKMIPEALAAYQQALEINPASKETKQNIELLIEQQKKDQQQKQQQQDQKQNKDQKQDQKQDPKNQKQQNNKDQNKDQDKNKDKDQQQKDQDKDKNQDKDQDQKDKKDQNKQMQSSPKYQPRPFKGDELSEGDVKKILGELRNQEQKIRANFDKRERKENRNEKDW